MSQPSRFTGKTVIVTGSSGGIGEGIARRFAAEGANVVLNSRNRAECEAVATTLDEDRTLIVEGDVSKSDFATEIVSKTVERFGALDILINNAGIARQGPMAFASDDDIDAVIDINVKGVMYLSRAAVPELFKSKGNIVNIASVSGLGGDWGMPIYNASKGAVTNLTRAMALELGRKGVRVNCICPSLTKSDMTSAILGSEQALKAIANRMPLGRPAEPDEIAGPTLFLASEDAVFVTGVNLPVDGGVNASNGQPNFMG